MYPDSLSCPSDRLLSEREAASLNVLVLAFLGDSVYSLLAREYVVLCGGRKAGQMHALSASVVNAAAQAAAFERIEDLLTEKELSVFRRAKNAHSTHTPKHMTESDYHCATGVEALFGYLYLSGQSERLRTLFSRIMTDPPVT